MYFEKLRYINTTSFDGIFSLSSLYKISPYFVKIEPDSFKVPGLVNKLKTLHLENMNYEAILNNLWEFNFLENLSSLRLVNNGFESFVFDDLSFSMKR
jgi:hypothetical protein